MFRKWLYVVHQKFEHLRYKYELWSWRKTNKRKYCSAVFSARFVDNIICQFEQNSVDKKVEQLFLLKIPF